MSEAPTPKLSPDHRPLSPHLQIYRWPVTMATSIAHRVSGVVNTAGAFLVTWWLVALAIGPGAYDQIQIIMDHWLGRLVLFGFSAALIFHLLNGVRHLVWDAGLGFELKTSRLSGWFVIIAAIVLTLLVWVYGYAMRGGGA